MKKSIFFKKITAFFILLTVSTQAVETHLFASTTPTSASPTYKGNHVFSLSHEIGKVEEMSRGSSGKKIIYIQDAHDSLEAQENIARTIDILVAKHGVKTVFEEGYEGVVPTDEYFGGIQDKAVKAKVSHYFLDKLRIGGAEYAHINRKKDFQLVGADNIKMHFENVSWYREAALYEKVTKEDLKELHHEVEQLAQARFPKDFKAWLKLKARSEAHEISLVDYLNRTMGGQGMKREKYPVLDLLLQAGKSESPALLEQSRHIDGKTLFEEIDRFENDYASTFLTSETDQKIFQYHKAINLLKRLSDIEMTSSEYATVKAYLESFSTQNLAEFLARETKKSMILPRQWESSIRHAVRFYELAKLRDEAVREKIEKWAQTSGENSAAIVFGGFHKEQIRQNFKELGISYVIVSPQMQSQDPFHKATYRDLMLRDYSRFEIPALVKQAATPPRGFELALAGGPVARAELLAQIQQVESAVRSVGHLQEEENLREAIDHALSENRESVASKAQANENRAAKSEADTVLRRSGIRPNIGAALPLEILSPRSEVRGLSDGNGEKKKNESSKSHGDPGFFIKNIFKFLIWFSELPLLDGYFKIRPWELELYKKMELVEERSDSGTSRHEHESVFLKRYKRFFAEYVHQKYLAVNKKIKLENGTGRFIAFQTGNLIARVAESAHLMAIIFPLVLMWSPNNIPAYLVINGINFVMQMWFIMVDSRSTRAALHQRYHAINNGEHDHKDSRSEVRTTDEEAEAPKKKYVRFPKVNEADTFRHEVFPGQTISTTDKKLFELLPFIQRNEEIPAGQEFISTRTGGSHGEIYLATLHKEKEKTALSYIGASHAEGLPIKPFIRKTGEREYSVGLSVKSLITSQYYPVTSYIFAKDGKILDGTPLPSNLQVSGKITAADIPFTTFPVVKEIIHGLTKGELPPQLRRLTLEDLTKAGLKGLFVKGRIDFWKDSVRLNTLRDFENTFLTLDPAPWLLPKNAQAPAPWVATLWIPAEGKRPEIPIDSIVLFSEVKFKSAEGTNISAGITRKRPFIAGRRGFEKVTGEIPEGKRAAGDVFKALWNIYWLAGGTEQVPEDDQIQVSHGNDPYLYRFNEKTVTIKLGPEFSKDQTTRSWVSFPGISGDARGIVYHNLQDGKIVRSQYFLLFKNGRFQMPELLAPDPSIFKTKVDLLSDELEKNITWMQSSAKQAGRLFFEQADRILGMIEKKENKEILPTGLAEAVVKAISEGIKTFSAAKKHIDVSEESKINLIKSRVEALSQDLPRSDRALNQRESLLGHEGPRSEARTVPADGWRVPDDFQKQLPPGVYPGALLYKPDDGIYRRESFETALRIPDETEKDGNQKKFIKAMEGLKAEILQPIKKKLWDLRDKLEIEKIEEVGFLAQKMEAAVIYLESEYPRAYKKEFLEDDGAFMSYLKKWVGAEQIMKDFAAIREVLGQTDVKPVLRQLAGMAEGLFEVTESLKKLYYYENDKKAQKMLEAGMEELESLGRNDRGIQENLQEIRQKITMIGMDLPMFLFAPHDTSDALDVRRIIQISFRREAIIFSNRLLAQMDSRVSSHKKFIAFYLLVALHLIKSYKEIVKWFDYEATDRTDDVWQGVQQRMGRLLKENQFSSILDQVKLDGLEVGSILNELEKADRSLRAGEENRFKNLGKNLAEDVKWLQTAVAQWDEKKDANAQSQRLNFRAGHHFRESYPRNADESDQDYARRILKSMAQDVQKIAFYRQNWYPGAKNNIQTLYHYRISLQKIMQKVDMVGIFPLNVQFEMIFALLHTGDLPQFERELDNLLSASYTPQIFRDSQRGLQGSILKDGQWVPEAGRILALWLHDALPVMLLTLQSYRDVFRKQEEIAHISTVEKKLQNLLKIIRTNQKFEIDLRATKNKELPHPLLVPIQGWKRGEDIGFIWRKTERTSEDATGNNAADAEIIDIQIEAHRDMPNGRRDVIATFDFNLRFLKNGEVIASADQKKRAAEAKRRTGLYVETSQQPSTKFLSPLWISKDYGEIQHSLMIALVYLAFRLAITNGAKGFNLKDVPRLINARTKKKTGYIPFKDINKIFQRPIELRPSRSEVRALTGSDGREEDFEIKNTIKSMGVPALIPGTAKLEIQFQLKSPLNLGKWVNFLNRLWHLSEDFKLRNVKISKMTFKNGKELEKFGGHYDLKQTLQANMVYRMELEPNLRNFALYAHHKEKQMLSDYLAGIFQYNLNGDPATRVLVDLGAGRGGMAKKFVDQGLFRLVHAVDKNEEAISHLRELDPRILIHRKNFFEGMPKLFNGGGQQKADVVLASHSFYSPDLQGRIRVIHEAADLLKDNDKGMFVVVRNDFHLDEIGSRGGVRGIVGEQTMWDGSNDPWDSARYMEALGFDVRIEKVEVPYESTHPADVFFTALSWLPEWRQRDPETHRRLYEMLQKESPEGFKVPGEIRYRVTSKQEVIIGTREKRPEIQRKTYVRAFQVSPQDQIILRLPENNQFAVITVLDQSAKLPLAVRVNIFKGDYAILDYQDREEYTGSIIHTRKDMLTFLLKSKNDPLEIAVDVMQDKNGKLYMVVDANEPLWSSPGRLLLENARVELPTGEVVSGKDVPEEFQFSHYNLREIFHRSFPELRWAIKAGSKDGVFRPTRRSEMRGGNNWRTYVRWGVRLSVWSLVGAAGYGVYRVIKGGQDLEEAEQLIYWAKVMLLALPVAGVAAGAAILWSHTSHFNWRRDGESKLGADREKIRGLYEVADAKKKKREAHKKAKEGAKRDFKSKRKNVTQGAGVSMEKIQSGDVPEVRYRIYLPQSEDEIVIVAANAKAFVQKFNQYHDQKTFKLTAAEGNEMWIPFVVSGTPVKVNIFNEKTPAILKRALDEAESRRSEVREIERGMIKARPNDLTQIIQKAGPTKFFVDAAAKLSRPFETAAELVRLKRAGAEVVLYNIRAGEADSELLQILNTFPRTMFKRRFSSLMEALQPEKFRKNVNLVHYSEREIGQKSEAETLLPGISAGIVYVAGKPGSGAYALSQIAVIKLVGDQLKQQLQDIGIEKRSGYLWVSEEKAGSMMTALSLQTYIAFAQAA